MTDGSRRPSDDEARAVAGYERFADRRSPDDPAHDVDLEPPTTDDAPDSDADLLAAAMGDPDAAAHFERSTDDQPDDWNPNAGGVGAPTAALPIAQLDALGPGERRRAAKKRGLGWPTTDDARERLLRTITEVMRHGDDRVVDAPTALGKSHTVTTTPWHTPQYDAVTGGRPVVHLSATRDARDEAVDRARTHYPDDEWMQLQSRHEACPVAAGTHDPPTDGDLEDVDHAVITKDGVPASDWLSDMCDGRGIPFSVAHRYLETHNDQDADLPCCEHDAECWAIDQWRALRDGDHSLVLATHNFAFVPGLRSGANIVVDEEPDYLQDHLDSGRVRRAVAAYLREIDATVTTWEAFITLARYGGYGDDAANERDALATALDREPDRDWYFQNDDAHVLAPALARAIFHADERPNGRRVGKTPYEPPRLEAHARDDDGWNREWVTVVLDEQNDVRTVRTAPDLSQARSVVGLDAHPCLPKWQANTLPHIDTKAVLDSDERRLWRRYERGLRVVQVGDATRPAGRKGRYYDHDGDRAVLEQLVDEYGAELSAAIGPMTCETYLRDNMQAAGIDDPQTMHYGEEKSRNDYADERVGFVTHCTDPGDDHIVDLLAELDLEATPERSEHDCPHCDGDGCERCDGTGHQRAHGRGFTGADAATAAAILASVRENHVAQAAGRWARNPDNSDSTATVYVRTDALPPGFADVQTPGAVWTYGAAQERIIQELRDADDYLPARELADRADCSKKHVRETLRRLADTDDDRAPRVHALEAAGPHGATLYKDAGVPNTGVVDLGETATSPVWGPYTWGVAISDPDVAGAASTAADRASTASAPAGLARWTREDGGDPPPDDPV